MKSYYTFKEFILVSNNPLGEFCNSFFPVGFFMPKNLSRFIRFVSIVHGYIVGALAFQFLLNSGFTNQRTGLEIALIYVRSALFSKPYFMNQIVGLISCGFIYIKVFVIAFSLLALYQPIGKEPKSELFTGSNNEYFTQARFKKVGAMYSQPQPPTHKIGLNTLQI